MLSRRSKDLTTGKRILVVVGWSIGLAVLLGTVSLFIGPTGDAPVTRTLRSASTGIALGAIVGAASARLITDRRRGAVVGAICGTISGILRWVVTTVLGTADAPQPGSLRLVFWLIVSAVSGLVFGALGSLLFPADST